MTIDKILVIILGILVNIFIYVFFFYKRERAQETTEITVSGGYSPSLIKLPLGKTSTLTFTRTDKNSCLEEIIIPDFKIKEYLPLNTPVSINITPTDVGEFTFHCGMNMFRGKFVVTK